MKKSEKNEKSEKSEKVTISADVISRSAVNSSNFDRLFPKKVDFGDRFGGIPDSPRRPFFPQNQKKNVYEKRLKQKKNF